MTDDGQKNEPAGESPKAPPQKKAKGGVEVVDAASDPLVVRLREKFGDGVTAAIEMVGQRIVSATPEVATDLLGYLKDGDPDRYDLLVDLTAVHRPDETPAVEVVYQLCSTSTFARVRVKVGIDDGAPIATVSGIWATANWLERECYDMFGIRFEGHPDLRRILLPDGWEGHPLRKEYPVEYRDNDWVRENLNIHALPDDADFSGKVEI